MERPTTDSLELLTREMTSGKGPKVLEAIECSNHPGSTLTQPLTDLTRSS